MQKIVLKPYGGLGNRLLAINAAINLKNDTKTPKLVVIWERNQKLYAPYKKLFFKVEGFEVIETKEFRKLRLTSYSQMYNNFSPSYYKYPIVNKLLGREKKYNQVFYNSPNHKFKFNVNEIRPSCKSMYIAAHDEFYTNQNSKFLQLEPTNNIKEEINKICKSFDNKTIGVHIRRKDSYQSILKSPDSLFENELKMLIKKGCKLFISTDDYNTSEKFSKMFKSFIISNQNSRNNLSRKSELGIKQAIIDLYCLSKSSFILGSYNSTFGYTAARIGNIKYKVLSI